MDDVLSTSTWECGEVNLASCYALFAVIFVLVTSWELANELVWIIMTSRMRFEKHHMLIAISEVGGTRNPLEMYQGIPTLDNPLSS